MDGLLAPASNLCPLGGRHTSGDGGPAAARGTFGGTASARSEEPVIGLSRIRDSATPRFRQCSFWSRTPGTSQYHAAKRANDRIGGSDARMDVTIRSGAASPL